MHMTLKVWKVFEIITLFLDDRLLMTPVSWLHAALLSRDIHPMPVELGTGERDADGTVWLHMREVVEVKNHLPFATQPRSASSKVLVFTSDMESLVLLNLLNNLALMEACMNARAHLCTHSCSMCLVSPGFVCQWALQCFLCCSIP